MQRLVGFDPSAEPVGDRLANLRIAAIALADEHTDWEGLDAWLESERVVGATLGRQVSETAKPDDTIDRRLEILDRAHAFSQNLRLFRSSGYDRQTLSKLQVHATRLTTSISERQGWELSTASNTRLSPLE